MSLIEYTYLRTHLKSLSIVTSSLILINCSLSLEKGRILGSPCLSFFPPIGSRLCAKLDIMPKKFSLTRPSVLDTSSSIGLPSVSSGWKMYASSSPCDGPLGACALRPSALLLLVYVSSIIYHSVNNNVTV